MKKVLLLIMSFILVFSLVGCTGGVTDEGQDDVSGIVEGETEQDEIVEDGGSKEITLEDVNEFLNNSADLGPGSIANPVDVIPFMHIDGPKNNSELYAFVNFQYEARDFIKYQVSYVSCTCRPAAVNYWQTAYVELSLPDSKNPDDIVLRNISFDKDPSGDYNGGLWADSNPTPAGVTYEIFRDEYIPFFNGKENSYLKNLDTMWDIDIADYKAGEGRGDYEIDTFTGSSVSANNIIRITNALIDFHSKNAFFE